MSALWLPDANKRFVEALGIIAETEGRWAIIGGFAVWIHLGGMHRVTLDIDTAAAPTAHQTLVAAGTPGRTDGQRVISGTELELIQVEDPSDVLDQLEDQDRLFVVAHWAAALRPAEATIHCAGQEVVVPVADWLPLLGCKLHAWMDRGPAQQAKRGSDGLDIIELIRNAPPVAAGHPTELSASVRWAAQRVLVEQPTMVRRLMLVHTDAVVGADEILDLGEALVAQLTP